jgi:cysteine-rich repeat protein
MSQFGGPAEPTDLCIEPNTTASVQIGSGDFIVLLEASGTGTDPISGTSARYLRASGCAVVYARSAVTTQVPVTLVEQPLALAAVCGNGALEPGEQCDDGGANGPGQSCNERCRFPERVANGPGGTGRRRDPTAAWAQNEHLVVGFNDSQDAYLHAFDENGDPTDLTADLPLDATPPQLQEHVALAPTPLGYAAGWTTFERLFVHSDVDAVLIQGFDPVSPPPMDWPLNPSSNSPDYDRGEVSVAASDTRVAWVFVDGRSGGVRIVTAPVAAALAPPAADTALFASGLGATGVSAPRIAAVSDGFAVAWASSEGDNVYALRTDALGHPLGGAVQVNRDAADVQDQPAIAARGADVLIAWRDRRNDASDPDGTTVRFRHFDAALNPEPDDHVAPTSTAGDQSAPSLAISPGGVALLAWQNGDGAIRGRVFHAADGTPAFNPFELTTRDFPISAVDEADHGTGPRLTPAVAFGGTNRFAVVWEDHASDLSTTIRLRVLRAGH